MAAPERTDDPWTDEVDAAGRLGAPAWSLQDTRRAWRRSLGRVWFRLAVLAALVVVAGVFAWQVRRDDGHLLRIGVDARAVVVETGYGGKGSQDWAEVRYWAGDALYDGTLNGPGPDQVHRGDHLTVVYDPDRPSSFRTQTYANHSDLVDLGLNAPWVLTGVLGFDALLIGRRLLTSRRWLRRRPWQRLDAVPVWFEPWYAKGARCYLLLTGTATDGTSMDSVARVGGSAFLYDDGFVPHGPQVLVCRGERRRAVLMTRSKDRLHTLRFPRSAAQARRWREHATSEDS